MIPQEVADIRDLLVLKYNMDDDLALNIAYTIYNQFDFCKCD